MSITLMKIHILQLKLLLGLSDVHFKTFLEQLTNIYMLPPELSPSIFSWDLYSLATQASLDRYNSPQKWYNVQETLRNFPQALTVLQK